MRKLPVLAAFGALALTALTACGSNEDSGDGKGTTSLTIAAPQGGVMPVDFRAGVERGIFKKHGLDIKVKTLATGLDDISAAVQGSADIGYSDIFGGASARGNGFDVSLVAPHNANTRLNYLLVPRNSKIRKPADLKGKTIAIGAPPLFRTNASTILRDAGVDPADVTFTLVKDQTTFGALLKSGQVDAASVISTIHAEKWIAQEGFRPVLDPGASVHGMPLDVPVAGWWATRDWFDANTKTAQRFTAAVEETHRWFKDLPPKQQADYVKEQSGADPVVLDREFPGLLNKLTVDAYSPAPGVVDKSKLGRWLATGHKFAKVPSIPLGQLLLPTVRTK
ncbi:ABC transporter substrate-binding protein [Streptomyces sp. NPDC005373]|uniref:ABC transporter substrate-binding protein n=1 Tax=Streptomyces sp. NPDC005373 TaxID=3156879 RepID=UPI0033A1DCDA